MTSINSYKLKYNICIRVWINRDNSWLCQIKGFWKMLSVFIHKKKNKKWDSGKQNLKIKFNN